MKPINRLKPAADAQALLTRAVALHQAGRWAEAGPLYERVLQRQPGHADALHLLGLVKGQGGDPAGGAALVRQALAANGGQAGFWLSLARLSGSAGQMGAAADAFCRALALLPAEAGGLTGLADALYDSGQPAVAARLYGWAVALDPGLTEAAYNRGAALRDAGQAAAALAAFEAVAATAPLLIPAQEQVTGLRHALGDAAGAALAARRLLALVPDQADALAILGNGLVAGGLAAGERWERGAAWLARALRQRPDPATALALAALWHRRGDAAAAVGGFRLALALAPAAPVGWSGLGLALAALGRNDGAVTAALRATRLAPDDPAVTVNAGSVLHQARRRDDAGGWHRRALALTPDSATGWINLGTQALEANAHDRAIPLFDRALRLGAGADEALARSNLGVSLMALGRNAAAAAAFRAALERVPGDAAIRSNLLFCLCFDETADLEDVFAEHRAFERFTAPSGVPTPTFAPTFAPTFTATDRNPERRLRIGYLSPDFQRYPGPGYHFLLPLIEGHDRAAVEVTCYHHDTVHDAATARFQAAADRWRDCAGLSDADLAALIRADGIDVLIDCDGHMSRNRMTLFFHRPAPIHISLPLYPNSTGLSVMEYQFADPRIAPAGADALRSERLIRLPGCVLCYRPADSAFAPPARPPVERNGVFTFGSFNNITKVNDATIALWARLLRAVPAARLLLKWRGLGSGGALDQRLLSAFAAQGVGADRLLLRGLTPDPYEDYTRIDVALDPVFANGGTTICDALWMGVPVLNRSGRAMISRWGASFLGAVGLDGLVADHDDAYVALGVRLATDRAFFDAQRADLRGRMARSPLMDEQGYARAVESACRTAWRRWCAGDEPVAFSVDAVAMAASVAVPSLPAPPLPGIPADALRRAARILVIKLDELGDFVLSTPFLRGLRASAPQAAIHLVVSASVVPLTEGCPHVDAVVSPTGDGAGGALNFRGRTPADLQRFAEAFRAGFDIAVTARVDFDKGGAATLAAASRAPIRLAHSEQVTPWKADANRGFDAAYTHTLPAGPARHEVAGALALLTALGGQDPGQGVELYPSAEELERARGGLAGRATGADARPPWTQRPRRLLAIAPTTASDRRNYPIPLLAALVARLVERAGIGGVVLVGAATDAARAAELARALASLCPLWDRTGATDPRGLTALLAAVDAVLAMDSGPAHIAAAVGTPVAVLSCHPQGGDPLNPHAPERFRPWSDAALVLQPPRATAPCGDGCRAAAAHCITGIAPDAAADSIAAFLRARAGWDDAPTPQPTPQPTSPPPRQTARSGAVVVSFPALPDAYPANRHWHAQLSSFVTRALVERFGGRVSFVPWDQPPPLRGQDAFVSFLPHPALGGWKRSVVLDNDNFDSDKWRFSAFRRFGYDAPLDPVADAYRLLDGQFARIVLVNDITRRRVADRDPRVADCWEHLSGLTGGRVSLHPHPIDKAFFSRLYGAEPPPDRARMLVYHGGPRKNSAELIALLRRLGFAENRDFSIAPYIDKGNDDLARFLLKNFFFVGNTSFSETGPINMWEYLTAGHIPYGHEDWWDGAGNPRLCWSYDPARQAENADNLDHLLRRMDVGALVEERDRLWHWWIGRRDNDWPCVTTDLCDQVDRLLSAPHPAEKRE